VNGRRGTPVFVRAVKKQFLDQSIELGDVLGRSPRKFAAPDGVGLFGQEFESHAHAGQGRAQLVRSGGQHLALLREQGLDGRGSNIEALGEQRDLILAHHGNPVREIARAPASRALGQMFEPACDATAERVEAHGHHQRQSEEHGQEEAAARSEVAALAQSQCASVAQIDEPDRPVKGMMPSCCRARGKCRIGALDSWKSARLCWSQTATSISSSRAVSAKRRAVSPVQPSGKVHTSERASGVRKRETVPPLVRGRHVPALRSAEATRP
jgi:hypothetical protein